MSEIHPEAREVLAGRIASNIIAADVCAGRHDRNIWVGPALFALSSVLVARDEAYSDGFNEGQSEANGAAADLWTAMVEHLTSVGRFPEIGEMGDIGTFTANDLMTSLREHNQERDAELQRLRDIVNEVSAERDAAVDALRPFIQNADAWENEPEIEDDCLLRIDLARETTEEIFTVADMRRAAAIVRAARSLSDRIKALNT